MRSSSKTVIVSSGVVSAAVILKLSLPVTLDFLNCSMALSWLQPPYLYLLINCIILSIVASSKLHPRRDDSSAPPPPEKFLGLPSIAPVEVLFGYENSPLTVNAVSVAGEDLEEEEKERVVAGGDGDDVEFVISRSPWTPSRREAVEYSPASSAEKPPVSSRFGHRKAVKASPEGKTMLKVSRPKRQETLESTWRTITEGRPMPLKRYLRKSDTLANSGTENTSPVRVLKKSETFAGGESSPVSGGRLRREPSLSQDELNRRVEAFIKKFNEEMRLQRQESLNQYKEMVGHGIR